MPCIVRRTPSHKPPKCPAGPGEAEPLHDTLAGLCARQQPVDRHETGGVARSIGWSRSSTPAGHRVAAVDRLRVSRLTFEKDTRTGLSREEIGYYACQIHLDADARALTGALKIAIITFGMWARTTVGSGKGPVRWPASAPPPSTFCAPKVARTSAKPSTSTPSTSTTCSRSAPHDRFCQLSEQVAQ